jgi:hypothetical protein
MDKPYYNISDSTQPLLVVFGQCEAGTISVTADKQSFLGLVAVLHFCPGSPGHCSCEFLLLLGFWAVPEWLSLPPAWWFPPALKIRTI